ncbi:hypothetical protein ACFLZJ_00050 [Nanoarchaeota archaeon]
MAVETILQSELLTRFLYPFLLVFFILFAILEKTKIFGDDKKQLNALLSFVIALIFIGFAWPKVVVGDLILFLVIALVVVFVGLMLWGFVSGGEAKLGADSKALKIIAGMIIVLAVIIAVLWATGSLTTAFQFLFQKSWSSAVWTNIIFIVIIVGALVLIMKSK